LFWDLDSRWVSSPYPVVILVMIVVSGLQELGAVVTMYETSGYLGPTHYMSSPPAGCEGKVLWIGERALVITCSRDRQQHYAVVGALNAPNLVICEFPVVGGNVGCSALPAAPRAAPPSATVTPPPAEAASPRQAAVDASMTRKPRRRSGPTPQAPESPVSPVGGAGVEASLP
jgi:hypothetical protein